MRAVRLCRLCGLALAGLFGMGGLAQAESDLPPPPPVVSEIVSAQVAGVRAYPGTLRAQNEVVLAFQAGGLLVERDVRIGDAVAAGAVLARLDLVALQEDTASARAGLRAAEAQAEAARLAYTRVVRLVEEEIATTAQLEAATAAQERTEASVRAAKAAVARAEDLERFGQLRAPSAGVVLETLVEAGATVTAGQPIIRFAGEGGQEVAIDVPSALLELFAPGAPMLVALSGEREIVARGAVRLVEPVSNASARNHRVWVALREGEIRLGSLVAVWPDVAQIAGLSAPQDALALEGDETFVWRVGAGRRLERVVVTTGARLAGRVQIRAGLTEGDEILTRGLGLAHVGMVVGERLE